MIESHIKHFLNLDGIKYFPSWFIDTKMVLKRVDGFVSIKSKINNSDGCAELWIRFEDDKCRQKWATSDTHKQIVEKLDPFRTRPFTVIKQEV